MPYTPTYATQSQVDEFLGDEEGTATEEEIRLAELDTDTYLSTVRSFQSDTGLKLNPDRLDLHQRACLARAVACQIQYRRVMTAAGPDFFTVPEYGEVSVGGDSRKGRRPKYSPKAADYLRRAGYTRVGRIAGIKAPIPFGQD